MVIDGGTKININKKPKMTIEGANHTKLKKRKQKIDGPNKSSLILF